ncbi:MAG: energy-coupling factor transporter transmembrane component T [Candidatus Krumholzibacteriia bacterium]
MARMIQYTAGDTFLHRLHPLSKLLVAALVSIASFLFVSWIAPVALAVFLALLHAPKPIGFARLRAVFASLPLFVALIVLANVFLVHGEALWWRNAVTGLAQSLRIVVLIAAANLFLAVTDPIDLSDAVVRVLAPLRRIGLRVGEISLMTMIAFSFIPLMADEVRRLQLAQAARCGFPKRGPAAIRAAVPLLVPLVIGVFRRADEIDTALHVRCYRMDAPRSSSRDAGWGRADSIVCAAALVIFFAGLYAHV